MLPLAALLVLPSIHRARRSGAWVLGRLLVAVVLSCAALGASAQDLSEVRTTTPLMADWQFVQDDTLTEDAALASTGEGWTPVSLPHTWNAEDAASLDALDYVRGVGWYRLELETPAAGARHWLEIGAASLIADVWLNGQYLGEHAGGFTAFRFDVTDVLAPPGAGRGAAGGNVLLVRVDNSAPESEDDRTAIAPLGGDFNVSGGLYRHVELISTPLAVHFALDDLGGPGVYAAATSIADIVPASVDAAGAGAAPFSGTAMVNVRAKLASAADAAPGVYTVRVSLVDADGAVAGSAEQQVELTPGTPAEIAQDVAIPGAHLWHGVADPYLYSLAAELVDPAGAVVDRIVQRFGIREMRFDPNEGFFLNGQPMRLRGVAIHQDFLGKGWAIGAEDIETSLAFVTEIGANAVRLGHYPFGQTFLERLSEIGLVAWAETAVGLSTTVERCSTYDASESFVENAELQLRELIRQQHSFPAVAMWAVGNESTAGQLQCSDPYDNVTPVIARLHEVAKQEDPSRPTAYAEFDENIGPAIPFPMGGITDLLGTNRYYYWYDLSIEEFEPLLDLFRERYPEQPLAISEYGAGAAVTHHTDDPLGGPPEVRSAPEGEVAYQPEEYAAYVHEQVYRVIESKPFLWGGFVWNLFDFGSARRNEGDVLGVNTKGLVTFDRQTRKDPFYFYKANWSDTPVTYIVGRRYTDRAYPVADVKVYSNADAVELAVNGEPVAALSAEQCEQRTCLFDDVALVPGANTLTVTGTHGPELVMDSVDWTYDGTGGLHIAAGRLATGYVSSEGRHFGSDEFFTGGVGGSIDEGDVDGGTPEIAGTNDPMLYKFFREGEFGYEIPVPNGSLEVTLGFVEPDDETEPGERVFDVIAEGVPLLEDFDVLAEAGGDAAAVTHTFAVEVADGMLSLEFTPSAGDALVSLISVTAGTNSSAGL